MRQQQRFSGVSIGWSLTGLILLAGSAVAGAAQHTTVRDAGGGSKIEMDYNADGRLAQMRTIGANGKLEQKADYKYIPGYYGPDQTDTSYWPNGKTRKITRNTYDASSNFTGEFVQVFDESGKQVLGHTLTHDPWTGVYRCAEWNVAAQNYKKVPCPSGEEEAGGEAVKKFTYDEVMQHLGKARQAAAQEQKTALGQTTAAAASNKEVGLVLPAQVHAGERVSGIVVEDPAKFDGMPEVTVQRVALPVASAGVAGWTIQIAGGSAQPADGPVTFEVPRGASEVRVTFTQSADPSHAISKTINLTQNLAKNKSRAPSSYVAAALCMKGQLCAVSGTFSGDSGKTVAAFEDRPARIVAETQDAAYISIPERTEAGSRPLFLAEGAKVVALPVTVGEFFVKNNGRELKPGQTLIVFPTLDGPGDIPDANWQKGNFPATNLAQARNLIPGFDPQTESREMKQRREAEEKSAPEVKAASKEEREEDEKKTGEILLVVKNLTPERVSLRASKNQMLVFRLNDESFSRGEFKYDLVVESNQPGSFDVQGYVIPLLAPVKGQEFATKTGASGAEAGNHSLTTASGR